jgi:hypothetical protein
MKKKVAALSCDMDEIKKCPVKPMPCKYKKCKLWIAREGGCVAPSFLAMFADGDLTGTSWERMAKDLLLSAISGDKSVEVVVKRC